MTVLLDMGCSLSLNKQCSASRRVRQDSSHSYVSRSTQRDHRTTREEAVGSDPKHDIRLQSILSRVWSCGGASPVGTPALQCDRRGGYGRVFEVGS